MSEVGIYVSFFYFMTLIFIIPTDIAFSSVQLSNYKYESGSDGKESTCNSGDLGSIPGLGRSLEEGMATHSFLLGESPWTKEPVVLQSMGLQRVRHD